MSDYAERAARFLQLLAVSPLGPARAAYWHQEPIDAYDESNLPGRWQFVVIPSGEGWEGDRDRYAELHGLVYREMSEPRLGDYFPVSPRENDPVAAAVLDYRLAGDRPRWVSGHDLGVGSRVEGIFMYPPALLGRPETPTANGTVSRPVAARATERPPVAAAAG